MRVLVTGGAGYIGDCVVDYLLQMRCGWNITVVDNLTYTDSYMRPDVKFKKFDITTVEFYDWLEQQETFDAIIHLAAMVGDGACSASPEYTVALNEEAVKDLCGFVKQHCPQTRFIFASTCSVYGNNNDMLTEESPAAPLSLYAGTKLNAEKYVNELENSVIFRLGTLYGISTAFARIRADLVANILTFKACEGQDLTVFGGDQWRPLIHVNDVGRIFAESATNTYKGTIILSGFNYKIIDIARSIEQKTGANIVVTDMKFEDLRNYKVDNCKAKSLGIKTMKTLSIGINEIIELLEEGRIKNPWITKYHNAKYIKERAGV